MNDRQDEQKLASSLIGYLRTRLGNPKLDYAQAPTALHGGFETSTYRFRLDGAPERWSGPLVLRLYPPYLGTRNAVRESAVQNVLAEQGYPVAYAHDVCTDMSVLGGAFFIMDCLPGQPLSSAPPQLVPGLLGRTHAMLHGLDPEPLVRALDERGVAAADYGMAGRLRWLGREAERHPCLRQSVDWLVDNCPPEAGRKAVCHGDFHVTNLLYADGRVTGVLDWPGFAIADPAFDVANSLMLITIPSKHFAATLGDFGAVDWELMAQTYLAAYREQRALDDTHLDYYRVRRCVGALAEGAEGHQVWRHPAVVQDLVTYVSGITGIGIVMPA